MKKNANLNQTKKTTPQLTSIVTGASFGIGHAFACELAKRQHNLVLVARSTNRLLTIKKELETKYKVKVDVVTADLSKLSECKKVYNLYKDKKIDLFINNAGFGSFDDIISGDIERNLDMLRVNILALQYFTDQFIKKFHHENGGVVLNIGSIGGYCPGPLLGTYSATKSYVHEYSLSVAYELKNINSPARCVVLCPGLTTSNFFQVGNDTQSHRNASEKINKKNENKSGPKLNRMSKRLYTPAEDLVVYALDRVFNSHKNVLIYRYYDKLTAKLFHTMPKFASKVRYNSSKPWSHVSEQLPNSSKNNHKTKKEEISVLNLSAKNQVSKKQASLKENEKAKK